ncbi:MAG: hydantoinase/oxoprolinase family protein [Deltaproteobacteria bacterium]|jgi:N-methylhydantoinase A/oxoprolinase/acetone carboxylase beta subunit|nr:hydantoinase/oxoprolinase family protein [Deltaproteobacteria bacterium]
MSLKKTSLSKPQGDLVLGLDTGGTNTDVVLFDPVNLSVLKAAKDFTTHHDLAIGIRGALQKLMSELGDDDCLRRIRSVNLSTTLATNAIAEGLGHRVGLVMVGFDEKQDIVQELIQKLPACSPVFIDGGHDYYGRPVAPLDEETLLREVARINPLVSAWAVSSFFSIKNPSHEARVAELIAQSQLGQDRPITLGQNLTGELGAVRRAATAALNAGLVLIIRRLLDAVKKSLGELGLDAPLMVVKGDGGLVSELWARDRPIETVVSGPAAGLAGARILARGFLDPEEKDLWVLDVGGTTSDLAYLRDNRPKTNRNGAQVGQWSTLVEAVETTTRGLGGDSLVDFDYEGNMLLGPRRVLPLCRLAQAHPGILDKLTPWGGRLVTATLCRFFTPNLEPDEGLNDYEKEIVELFRVINPVSFAEYQEDCLFRGHLFPGLRFLTHPAILVSGFTPTDALSVLGLFKEGIPEASHKAAYLLGMLSKETPEEFSRRVLNLFGEIVAEELVKRAISEEGLLTRPEDFGPRGVLRRAIAPKRASAVSLRFSLSAPVILLGAPAGVLTPWVQKFLDARVIAPPRFAVASATGAAASNVVLSRRVNIVPLPDSKTYRAFLPDRLMDGGSLNELVADATAVMSQHMAELALIAGAGANCPISMTRDDREVLTGDGATLPMGTTLHFTAGYLDGAAVI